MIDWTKFAYCAGGWLVLTLALWPVVRRLEAKHHPLGATARALRNLVLPIALFVLLGIYVFQWEQKETALRVSETVLWIAVIAVSLSLVKNTAFTQHEGGQYQTRVPKLLLDILRLLLVAVGGCIVISQVWGAELGSLLTAVGVSSIVLGLALQNTLDNVMAGIAVLLERPFEVGDWIQVGSITGQVTEMNWRSVRVRTRARDQVVVPNSVIGKETLVNYSRPTRMHGETHVFGFSYDDPPNKVKRVLHQVALATRGVLADPAPHVRTHNYGAWSIEYEVRFFVEDFARQQEIVDEFKTQVWYAAKRNGLVIPFPIQTSYEYRMSLPPPPPAGAPTREALAKVPVFVPLGGEELEVLSRDAVRQQYGQGECVVSQGDPGDALFVVLEGTAVVSVRDEQGSRREVARLARGEFFGEMALLTGEPRTATVTAADDLSVLVIFKETMQAMLTRRPPLANEIAEIVAARRSGLRAIQELRTAPAEQREQVQRGAGEVLQRIVRFFGL